MSNTLTTVRLINVPLENDYKHTFHFDTRESQTAYFMGLSARTVENCSYQRKEKIIRFPACVDELIGYNYLMYRNAEHSSKWYYAFITKMEYKNDEMTEISFEIDVLQSWLRGSKLDYNFKASFVEREHVDNDEVGRHTYPEQLETGDYKCNRHTKAGYAQPDMFDIVVGVTVSPAGVNAKGKLYNNIYSGIDYYVFTNDTEGIVKLQEFIDSYPDNGAMDAITCMFLVPRRLIVRGAGNEVSTSTSVDKQYINGDPNLTFNTVIDMSTGTLDGYTPTNKKLLSYPYRYLLVGNNAGTAVPFHYELFEKTENDVTRKIKPQFIIEGCLTPSGSIRMTPLYYNGAERNDEEGINMGKFPCLNWTSDVYTNWLTQNGINMGLGMLASGASVVGGIGMMATGAGAGVGLGMIAGGAMGIANTIAEVNRHSMQPPQSNGNTNSGDVVTASGNNDFHFYDMTIKREYAQIIDEFFTMFGYKTCRVKVPSYGHRENYWYIKTQGANIDGGIPVEDMVKIKSCYDNGVTFWSNPANIGNYAVSNEIVG